MPSGERISVGADEAGSPVGAMTAFWAGEGGGLDMVRDGGVQAPAVLGPAEAQRNKAQALPSKCPQSGPNSARPNTWAGVHHGPSPPAGCCQLGKMESFGPQSCQVSVPAQFACC